MEEEAKEKTWEEKVCEQVESQIKTITDQQVQPGNADYLYKLVDIHKDLENEKYWKEKTKMMYRNSGSYGRDSYGRGRERDSRGRFMENGYSEDGNYGRRGNYRGEEAMGEMNYQYGNYSESRDAYNRGNYGAKEDSMKSLKYMLQAMEDFGMYLMEDAETEEERSMIKHTLRKMGEK